MKPDDENLLTDPLYLKHRSYFFDQGLYFECRQCGACCTGAPGAVYVNKKEIAIIARYLHMKQDRFIRIYLYPLDDRYSIGEDSEGCCLFYRNGCIIYPVRPDQCKTYPFWFQNLRSEENWQRFSQSCPGIGKGRKYKKEEILSTAILTLNL